jgi:hypothetical protein
LDLQVLEYLISNSSNHCLSATNKMYSCNNCDKTFAVKSNLTRHLKEVHNNMKRSAQVTVVEPKSNSTDALFQLARENVNKTEAEFNMAMNTAIKIGGIQISKEFVNDLLNRIDLKIGQKEANEKEAKLTFRNFQKQRNEEGRPEFTTAEQEMLDSISDNINQSATYWEKMHQFVLAQLYLIEVKLAQFNYEQTSLEKMKNFWTIKLDQLNAEEAERIAKKAKKAQELADKMKELQELAETSESQFT